MRSNIIIVNSSLLISQSNLKIFPAKTSYPKYMKPREAIGKWHIGTIREFYPVTTGLFNETYIARSSTGVYVLQKLHPLISRKEPTQHYLLATMHLASKNLPAQRIILSKRGEMLVKDGVRAWRLMTAVPGHVYKRVQTVKMAEEAGKQLGLFHLTFRDFKEPIQRPHPMFRYDEVLDRLRSHEKKLSLDADMRIRQSASFILDHFQELFLPKNLPHRLIHTDPKISNFVFDNEGRAVAMIDLDTVQYLSPLYDLGDALRSLCGKEEDNPYNSFDMRRYRAFLKGYRDNSKGYLSAQERRLIPRATGLVILGLAARFLNDYVDDSYFNFDPKRYGSRKAHNLARTLGQIALYKSFRQKIKRL